MLSATNRQYRVRPLPKDNNHKTIQKKRHVSSKAGSEGADYKKYLTKNGAIIITGVITGISSLLEHKFGLLEMALKHELTEREQKRTAQAAVDKARRPLLISAMRLLSRIHHIQHSEFFGYLKDSERKERAMQSTLYDFSKYWCLSNKLHLEVDLLHSDIDSDSKRISTKLNEVTRMCSTDTETKHLMIWTNEQCAVGELMLDDKGEPLGFVAFTQEYTTGKDCGLKKWLKNFEADLKKLGAANESETIYKETNARLTKIGKSLAELVYLLDKDKNNSTLTERQKEKMKEYENNEDD